MRRLKIVIQIFSFSFMIAVVLFLFKNIERLMPNYEGKVITYSNKYYENQEKSNPLEYVERATLQRDLTQEEEQLFDTEVISKLYQNNIEKDKETLSSMLQTELLQYSNKYVIPETKYGDIVYQVHEIYDATRRYHITNTIIFTKDQKSIYYNRKNSSKKVYIQNLEQEMSKETLVNELQEFINSLKIPITKFEPTVISKDTNEYLLKDENQKLEIVYDTIREEIKEFSLNFY